MPDVIEIVGRHVGDTPRVGEIVEVIGDDGNEHYRVRWEDGHESLFYPGAGVHVHRSEREERPIPEVARVVVEALRSADISFELLPHKRVRSATGEAVALHVDPHRTAKTIVVRCGDGYVRATVPASRRLNLVKLGHVVGTPAVVVGEDELDGAYPQFELGAVPPFGGPDDRVVIDAHIAACDDVVLEAGSHSLSVRLSGRDLVEVAHAEVADIATA